MFALSIFVGKKGRISASQRGFQIGAPRFLSGGDRETDGRAAHAPLFAVQFFLYIRKSKNAVKKHIRKILTDVST